MDLQDLLEAAKKKTGTYGALAAKINRHQNRFAEWKKGVGKPDASEIAAIALEAQLPVFETVAEIESKLNPEYANVWKLALETRVNRSFYGFQKRAQNGPFLLQKAMAWILETCNCTRNGLMMNVVRSHQIGFFVA